MVNRLRGVRSHCNTSLGLLTAVADRFVDKGRGCIVHAGLERSPRGKQVTERRERKTWQAKRPKVDSINQRLDEEVVVDVLEEADTMSTDIRDLKDITAINLSLDS